MLGTPCRAPELITSANYCLAGKIGVGWGTEIPRIFYTKLINIDEIEMRDGKPSGLLCLTEVPVCTVQITVHPTVWPPHTSHLSNIPPQLPEGETPAQSIK